MALRTLLLLSGILAHAWAQPAPAPSVTLSVHLVVACSSPDAGPKAAFPGLDAADCLDRAPFLTQKDVQVAEARRNSQGHTVVFLTFREDAAIRELNVTRRNTGHRVAILVNGRVAAAPPVSTGSRFLYIDGGYTAQQAEALVAAFNRQAGLR